MTVDRQGTGGVTYAHREGAYFERRGLARHAGLWSVWALGVGAVISGHFSGWNFGFATGGWGGMLAAAAIIAVMYLGLTYCIAEMSAALPHTGAAYSFARSAMGPWGGFLTGLFENIEYVLAPAVVVTFIGGYAGGIFGLPGEWQPLLWVGIYAVFLLLNICGAALSFRVTVAVTLVSLAVLALFWISALPRIDIARWALDIAPDGSHLPGGNGPAFPFGVGGVLATLPFAVWLFLAIEQVPLAAEESIAPRRDLPRGILLAFGTLVLSAGLIIVLNPGLPGLGSFALGRSGEPLLDGFRALYGETGAAILGGIALTGLIASFHTILYAQGRQIYSLSRAGYFPTPLSVTHARFRTPHVAMIAGSAAGLGLVLVVWFASGGPASDWTGVSALLLNMVVFGAMLSYVAQALSFILLRIRRPAMPRPFRSPFGLGGAIVTIAIALLTLAYQLQDPAFLRIVPWVVGWLLLGLAWFALVARHRLILSPEEEFALGRDD